MKIIDHNLVWTDTICNKCAMSCRDESWLKDAPSYNGLQSASVVGSYWSTHVNDGDVHEFDLCERCFMELAGTFKRSSFIGNYMNPNHVRTGFHRAKYVKEGKKLWENLSEEERKSVKSVLFDNLDWLDEMPKCELIYYLYELEYEQANSGETPERRKAMIDQIKKVLEKPCHKEYK